MRPGAEPAAVSDFSPRLRFANRTDYLFWFCNFILFKGQCSKTNRSLLTAPDHSSLKNYRSENQDREVASTKPFPETHKLKYYIFMKTFLKYLPSWSVSLFILLTSHFSSLSKDINLDSDLFNTCDSMFTLTDKSGTTSEADWSSGPLPGRTKRSSPSAALSPPVWAGFRGGRGRHAGPFVPLWRAHIRGHMGRKTGWETCLIAGR